MEKNFLTTAEVAKMLKVSIKTVKRWRTSGKLIPDKSGNNGYSMYSKEKLIKNRVYVPGMVNNSQTRDINPGKENNMENTPYGRIGQAKIFLNAYFNEKTAGKFAYLWTMNPTTNEKETIHFRSGNAQANEIVAKNAITENNNGRQAYFSVNLTDTPTDKNHRAKSNEITAQVALVADIDIESRWHVNKDGKQYPPNIETAKEFLPCEPSILVDSGGGLHAYYIFTEPLKFATNEERLTATRRNTKFIEIIRKKAAAAGYVGVDSVGDLSRVLRLPGTFNFKAGTDNAPLCKIVSATDKRFTPAEIDEIVARHTAPMDGIKPAREIKSDTTFEESPEYKTARIVEMLKYIDPSSLDYDEWLKVGMALKSSGNGNLFDDWSRNDSRYKDGECRKKLDSFKGEGVTVATLHEMARNNGYIEKDFYREWHQAHPTHTIKHRSEQTEPTDESKILSPAEKFVIFSLPQTDLGDSRRFLKFAEEKIRWLEDSVKWALYDPKGFWKQPTSETASLFPICQELGDLIKVNAEKGNEPEQKLAARWQRRKVYTNAVELAKYNRAITITQDDLNTHRNLLNCQNGVIDLETGKVYPHRSENLITQQINCEYRASEKDETVTKLFEGILPDEQTRSAFLRFLGYCLTGEIYEEKALFIHGCGGNGKGTVTAAILNLLGEYGTPFPIESLLLTRFQNNDGNGATPAFNTLLWRRLAICEEIPPSRQLDFARFKLLTGGDRIPIRRLREESSEIKDPTHKLILSGNDLPELHDPNDDGLKRRLLVIPFEQKFTDENRDPLLKKKLQQPSARRALLSLLVDNARQWYKGGLIVSEKMTLARQNYLDSNDFIGEFISTFCENEVDYNVPRKAFIEKLKSEYPKDCAGMNDRRLVEIISKVEGVEYRRGTGGGYRFFGIRLKDNYQANFSGDFVSNDKLPPM